MNYRIEDPEKFKSKWVIKIEEISRPPTKLCSGAKLIKKRREGEVSRVKLKFGLTNVQGVDNSKGQSAADKIIVVSYVSWSISLNGWMQPNEARRRITSTPYLSSFRLNIAGRSVFRLENRPFSATFDINYISFLFHFHSLYLRYSYFYIYIICTIQYRL